MPKLVKDGAIVENDWQFLPKPEGNAGEQDIPEGKVIVPLHTRRPCASVRT